jgi:medium-chain acyl-[acyl-carrier-protein] hydrolase
VRYGRPIATDASVLAVWSDPPARSVHLVCVPHAGSGAAAFRSWRDALPEDVALLAARLPGRESRLAEPPHESMAAVVDELVAALRPLASEPIALLGQCSGALIAFEVARELRRRSLPAPVHLFALGIGPPRPQSAPAGGPARTTSLGEVEGQLRALGGTDPEILGSPEMIELLAPILRADLAVYESFAYTDEEPLATPVAAFIGEDDALVDSTTALEWRNETTKRFSLHVLPGSHFLDKSWDLVPLLAGALLRAG